jgi:hypothetical protein
MDANRGVRIRYAGLFALLFVLFPSASFASLGLTHSSVDGAHSEALWSVWWIEMSVSVLVTIAWMICAVRVTVRLNRGARDC